MTADASTLLETKVRAFPYALRRTLICRIASELRSCTGKGDREELWLATVGEIAAELRVFGAREAEIEDQLSRFHQAIAAQLRAA